MKAEKLITNLKSNIKKYESIGQTLLKNKITTSTMIVWEISNEKKLKEKNSYLDKVKLYMNLERKNFINKDPIPKPNFLDIKQNGFIQPKHSEKIITKKKFNFIKGLETSLKNKLNFALDEVIEKEIQIKKIKNDIESIDEKLKNIIELNKDLIKSKNEILLQKSFQIDGTFLL